MRTRPSPPPPAYYFPNDQIPWLLALLTVNDADIVRSQLASRSHVELVTLTQNFIAMAKSVVENCAEHANAYLIEIGHFPLDMAGQRGVNMPTLQGALAGQRAANAITDQRGLCAGCAFRHGTPANQSPNTIEDALYLAQDQTDNFMCHEKFDQKGNPTNPCRGFKKYCRAQGSDG